MAKDVHTEHCCIHHGCKYMSPQTPCTVESGEKTQSHPCEECGERSFKVEQALQRFRDDFESDFMLEDGLIVDHPERRWGPLLPLYHLAVQALEAEERW